MKISVCVKRVPSTTTRLRIAPDGKSINESGVEYVLSPYDEFAVEEALRLVEKAGQGEVTVLTVGPEAAQKELRNCLAMGAHRAIHVVADTAFRDGLATAKTLAAALKTLTSDLILFGRQAVDHDNAQVGLMVATLLSLPAVPDVVKLELADRQATVEREIEGGARQVFSVPLPCVLTAQKGLNEPRYPNLKGIMNAKKKPIDPLSLPASTGTQSLQSIALPPERKAGRILPGGKAAVPELLKILRDEIKAL